MRSSMTMNSTYSSAPITSMLMTIGESQRKYEPPPLIGISTRMTAAEAVRMPAKSILRTFSRKPPLGGFDGSRYAATPPTTTPSGASR